MKISLCYFIILLCAALVSFGSVAFAHGGGLNQEGCHNAQSADNEKPALHCHHSQAVADYYAQRNTDKLGWYRARVLHVIDGDTFRVKAHIWLGHSVETNVRVQGIDTPELRRATCAAEKQKGEASRQALIDLAGKEVILHRVAFDKYGDRVLADVYNKAFVNIGLLLVESGHARLYDGKTARQTWC